MQGTWQAHIHPLAVIKLLKWSRANIRQIVAQDWRKDNFLYRDGWLRAKRDIKVQDAIIHYLQTGEPHASPNFGIWLNYYCWWAILIEYGYNRHYLDDTGSNSTFHRLCTWLRIARDEALGLETEPEPQRPVTPMRLIDLYFDAPTPEQADVAWHSRVDKGA